MKHFLSSVKTKKRTDKKSKTLAQYIVKKYIIVYGNPLLTNLASLDEQLCNYIEKEAGTGIALHEILVTKRDLFFVSVIMCSDTDVFVLLLRYFEMISTSTILKTTEHEYILRRVHENLTPDICKALSSFNTLSRCDQIRTFPGYSKRFCWDVVVTLSNEVLQALTNQWQI